MTDKPAEKQRSIGGWTTQTLADLPLAHIESKDTKNQPSQGILFKSNDETMTQIIGKTFVNKENVRFSFATVVDSPA